MKSFDWVLVAFPLILQASLILFDEFYFHTRREFPRWEKIGHPLDTMTVIFCYGFLYWQSPSAETLRIYFCLVLFSCFFVTKDEFVHHRHSTGAENLVHALLFVLHPIVLGLMGWLWYTLSASPEASFFNEAIMIQICTAVVLLSYQLIRWNTKWLRPNK